MENNKYDMNILKDVEKVTKSVSNISLKQSRGLFRRYPLTFSFLGLIGFTFVIYGLENSLDRIEIVRENPLVVLIVGIFIMLLTGTLYKWLQNKEINIE